MIKKLLIVVISAQIVTANAQDLTDGLLLYMPLDGNAIDMSGNGFDGVSSATPGTDRLGNPMSALDFNGVDQYVSFPNDDMLKPDLPLSFSLWFYPRSLPASPRAFGLFANDDTTTEYYTGVFAFFLPTGQVNVSYGDGGITTSTNRRTLTTNETFALNEWHHVVCVVNGATDMHIYTDCQDATGFYDGSGGALYYTSSNGSLGRRKVTADPYLYFNGLMDEVAYWNRALTIAEVSELCNGSAILPVVNSIVEPVIVSPNPTQNNVHVNLGTHWKNYSIFEIRSIDGRLLEEGNLTNQDQIIDLSKYPAGVYALIFIDKNFTLASTAKVIKQ